MGRGAGVTAWAWVRVIVPSWEVHLPSGFRPSARPPFRPSALPPDGRRTHLSFTCCLLAVCLPRPAYPPSMYRICRDRTVAAGQGPRGSLVLWRSRRGVQTSVFLGTCQNPGTPWGFEQNDKYQPSEDELCFPKSDLNSLFSVPCTAVVFISVRRCACSRRRLQVRNIRWKDILHVDIAGRLLGTGTANAAGRAVRAGRPPEAAVQPPRRPAERELRQT